MVDFNYRIDGTALVPTIANHVTIPELAAGVRAQVLPIAFRDGGYVSDEHSTDVKVVPLVVDLAGETDVQIYTAYHALLDLVYGAKRTLAKLDPVAGEVEAEILAADDAPHGQGATRQRIEIPILFTRGYWETVAVSTETDNGLGASGSIGPFTPGGSHRTYPKFTITCQTAGSNPSIEEPVSGAILLAAGSFVSSDVVVIDVADRINGGVTLNGTRAKNLLSVNRGYWMRFVAGVAHTLDWTSSSGLWDVVTTFKDRYR